MKKKFWQFRDAVEDTGKAELLLFGELSQQSWYGDEVTPKQFEAELRGLGDVKEIEVQINSGGGDVFAAFAIGNLLARHKAHVTARIMGCCASAATIVACLCDTVRADAGAIYMIHPVSMCLAGCYGADDMQRYIDALGAIRTNIVELYAKKTGRDKDEVAGWMDATSWWTGSQAKDNGFVDEVTQEEDAVLVENRSGALFVNGIGMNRPFDGAPEFVRDSLAVQTAGGFVNTSPAEQPEEQDKEETKVEQKIKTVDELRGAYPDLVDALEKQAAENAVREERQRIMDIEEMAMPGNEEMTREALFGAKPMCAAEYAVNLCKAQKQKAAAYAANSREDVKASGMEDVRGGEKKEADAMLDAIRDVGKHNA